MGVRVTVTVRVSVRVRVRVRVRLRLRLRVRVGFRVRVGAARASAARPPPNSARPCDKRASGLAGSSRAALLARAIHGPRQPRRSHSLARERQAAHEGW